MFVEKAMHCGNGHLAFVVGWAMGLCI